MYYIIIFSYVFLKLVLFIGGTMVPISWTEMQCPLTGQIEQRKVAKVGA